jgi:chaperone modulatory protein CbpM
MMQLEAVVALFPDLEPVELTAWIEHRWVLPQAGEGGVWTFHEIDIARVRLIYDLRRHLDTPEETLPVVLSLVDQVYDMRRKLNAVSRALESQPQEIRAAVLAILRDEES